MKTIVILVLLIPIQGVLGQNINSDSVTFRENLDKYINREFLTLSTDTQLSSLETKYGTPLNSVGKCLVIFSRGDLNEVELRSMAVRAQEIATKFYEEGTPIYLSIGGSQSSEWTKRQNEKGNNKGLTFVSLGNYCVVEKGDHDFERIFNKKTLELVGIERVE